MGARNWEDEIRDDNLDIDAERYDEEEDARAESAAMDGEMARIEAEEDENDPEDWEDWEDWEDAMAEMDCGE